MLVINTSKAAYFIKIWAKDLGLWYIYLGVGYQDSFISYMHISETEGKLQQNMIIIMCLACLEQALAKSSSDLMASILMNKTIRITANL